MRGEANSVYVDAESDSAGAGQQEDWPFDIAGTTLCEWFVRPTGEIGTLTRLRHLRRVLPWKRKWPPRPPKRRKAEDGSVTEGDGGLHGGAKRGGFKARRDAYGLCRYRCSSGNQEVELI